MGFKINTEIVFFKVAKRFVFFISLLVIVNENIKIDYVDISSVNSVKTLLPETQGFQRQVNLRWFIRPLRFLFTD